MRISGATKAAQKERVHKPVINIAKQFPLPFFWVPTTLSQGSKLKRHNHRRPVGKNGRLLFFALAPMLFILSSSFGYAQWADHVTTTAHLSSGTEDILITHYNATSNSESVDIIIALDQKSITIEEPLLFPGWQLNLTIEIHNNGTLALWMSSKIQCDNENITETQLLNLFRIDYTDGFYLEPGPDNTWFTADDEPVPDLTIWQLLPNDNWYKLEGLFFDAQEYPELEGESVTFQIAIYGSFTGGP